MYKILLTKEAVKFYKKSDTKIKRRLNKCFEELKTNPFTGANIKRLHGELEGLFRYRIGSLRVIYNVTESKITVTIVTIGNRGDIYK